MNLNSVGRQIARKCQGMPLIATTLGNMLRGENEWRFVLKKELWAEEAMFLRLIQSYIYLPPHLQQCFAYCSIFPQGHVFEVDELAFLWAAEGFVNVQQGDQTLEDLARGYFNDLRLRFVFEKCEDGMSYKMHDLMHGMARLVSKDICFHIGKLNNSYPLFGNACHLSLLLDIQEKFTLEASIENERLRTFLLMRNNKVPTIKLDAQLFSHLKHLRVLGLGGAGLEELSESVSQLIYLRYLNLSDNPIYKIPLSMGKLKALHTLKLCKCPNLKDLPEEMINLINLRHLDMDISMNLPPQFGKLTNLESLPAKIDAGMKNTGRGIGELKSMNCLRGSLCITKINEVESETEAREAELGFKTRLDKLELQWMKPTEGDLAAHVLDALKPHTNLDELVIEKYCGTYYPYWLSDSSRSLTKISLKGLMQCDCLPSLGELPSLKSFIITDMPCLALLDHKLYGTSITGQKFPSLKRFELRGLPSLVRWEVNENSYPNAMPHLKEFTIHDCTLLRSLPPNIQILASKSNVTDCPSLELIPA